MRKIITYGIIALLCFILTSKTYSQENFIPGYIIENNDTLKGHVDFRDWKRNPKTIQFKIESNSKSNEYSPKEISGFGIENEVFVSAIVKAEISSENPDKLEENAILNCITDTVFLQTLIEGPKSLYSYIDKDWNENYYIKNDSTIELLAYKKYLKTVKREGSFSTINNRFKGQLSVYLKDCSSINKSLKNAEYKKNKLLKIFKNYYKCSQSQVDFVKKAEKAKLEYGALMGASITSINFESDFHPQFTEPNFDNSYNFCSGLYFDILLPSRFNKLSFNNEIFYYSYGISGKYEDYTDENRYEITSVEFGHSYIVYNLSLRYKYPVGKMFLFANVGFSEGISVSITNNKTVERKFYVDETITEGEAITDPRRAEQSIILGAGIKYKKISFEYRYAKSNGLVYTLLHSSFDRHFFVLGYNLSK